jgi:hypothetical protein
LAEVGKILFVENLVGEKRRERLHTGECRGTRKQVIPFKALKNWFSTQNNNMNVVENTKRRQTIK